MENDILDSLNDLGYEGPLKDEVTFAKALDGGPKSLEFTKLVHILAEELKKLCRLEEAVSVMNHPDESSSFLLELSSFLKELGCPYKSLVTGHMSSRLQSREDRILLLDYMISELMAARMVQVDCPKDKQASGMDIVVQESPTAKDLKEILIALKFNKPPPNITAEMLFSKLESKLKETLQKEGDKFVGKPLYNKALAEKDWKNLETAYSEMFEEYRLRRETLITRLQCTIQSFEWSDRLKSKKDTIQSVYRPMREKLKVKPNVKLSDFLAARTSLLHFEKTSSASVRKNTQSEVNKVIIGQNDAPKWTQIEELLRMRRQNNPKLDDGTNSTEMCEKSMGTIKKGQKSETNNKKTKKQHDKPEILLNEVAKSRNESQLTNESPIYANESLIYSNEANILIESNKRNSKTSGLKSIDFMSKTQALEPQPNTSDVEPKRLKSISTEFKLSEITNPNLKTNDCKPSKNVRKKLEKQIAKLISKYSKIPQIVTEQLKESLAVEIKSENQENNEQSTQTEFFKQPNDEEEYKMLRQLQIECEREMTDLIFEQHLEGIIELPGKQSRSMKMSIYEKPEVNITHSSMQKEAAPSKENKTVKENSKDKTLKMEGESSKSSQNYQPVNAYDMVLLTNSVASLYLKTPDVKQNLENTRKKTKKGRKHTTKDDDEYKDVSETVTFYSKTAQFDPSDNKFYVVILDKNGVHFDFYKYTLVLVIMNIALKRYQQNPYTPENSQLPVFTRRPRFKHGGVRMHPRNAFTVKWVREIIEGLGSLWQWSDGLKVEYETDLIKMRNRSRRSNKKRPR